jgi:hypothetical protein
MEIKTFTIKKIFLAVTTACILASCEPPAAPPDQADDPAVVTLPAETGLPAFTQYNLGETTITQATFPEDSRFRNMPVRLNGIIAAPTGNEGPYPVVVILHGNHPGCPVPEWDTVDRWPCAPEAERPNYRGFEYLVRRLAAQGYVALSINVNAEYTFGFGEPVPFERLGQVVDLHLEALSEAARGGENPFGLEIDGSVDLNRLAFIGHSQGGEGAYWLTDQADLDSPESFTTRGYGPVHGILMVAPSANWGGAASSRVPFTVLLPACDQDVINQEGQIYYEINRLDRDQIEWASSAWLERANHNYFNETLSDEAVARPGRPDCEPLLDPETQRDFLSEYTIDFLGEIFSDDRDAFGRLGLDFQVEAPGELYGLPARIAALAPRYDRFPILLPADESELKTNLAGGEVTAQGVTTFYCEEGYYTPMVKPGSEPCKRVNLVIPGNPAMVVLSWEKSGASLSFSLPTASDLSQFSAISLRAAVDPLSPLNDAGVTQSFTIQLVDQDGNTASMSTRENEPALQFPEGSKEEDDVFEGGLFSGRVPLTSIRMPLSVFSGVDLAQIREIILLFDQAPAGALFISDIELVR